MIARTGGPAWRRDMTSRIWSAGHVFYRRQADGDFSRIAISRIVPVADFAGDAVVLGSVNLPNGIDDWATVCFSHCGHRVEVKCLQRAGGTTIKKIAEELGVHPSTVSRALNPTTRGLIGKETSERIERAAKKLGYYPNAAAASLRTGRSKLIGVFLPDISNPVFSPILSGIAEVTSDSGFATIVADVGTESRSQTEMMFELVAPRVEGLILATVSRKRRPGPAVHERRTSGCPREPSREPDACVVRDVR